MFRNSINFKAIGLGFFVFLIPAVRYIFTPVRF